MPLSVLLVLVVAGIAGIALVLHLTGRSDRLVMAPEDALAAWARHFPGDDAVEAMVSQDGHGALILSRAGPGLVWAVGADTVARRLRDFDVIETADGLSVRFRDFSAPRADLKLAPEMHRQWLARMNPQ